MNVKRNTILAVIFIVVGILWILGNAGFLGSGEIVLYIISGGLFAGYFVSGGPKKSESVGFLIPACIVFMIGTFVFIEETLDIHEAEGTVFFLLLATAFLAVYLIHGIRQAGSFGDRNWALITSIAVYAFAGMIYLIEYCNWEYAKPILENIWPIGLIAAGLLVLVSAIRKR